MTYYLGKVSKNEYLILKNQNKITFNFNTICFQGIKKFYNTNYLNVLNPDNFIYNLETEIHEFIKNTLIDYDLKSNIIFDQKQFLQFKIDDPNLLTLITPETKLNLDIEVDKIKINEKTKSYQILLKLIKCTIKN
jgi:hypothetical protein